MRLAILASGSGTNAKAIVQAVQAGILDAEIPVILTNKENAGVIEKANALGVHVEIVPSKGWKNREEYDALLVQTLSGYDVDTIALAGWMRILSNVFLDAYKGRILNLHPAILPSFTGDSGIDDAFAYGVKLTGCTVHLVSPVLDGGPIVIQAAVPVCEDRDELEERIHKMEHLIFPQALQWFAQGRVELTGNKTRLLPSSAPKTAVVDGCLINPPLEIRFQE